MLITKTFDPMDLTFSSDITVTPEVTAVDLSGLDALDTDSFVFVPVAKPSLPVISVDDGEISLALTTGVVSDSGFSFSSSLTAVAGDRSAAVTDVDLDIDMDNAFNIAVSLEFF